MLKMASPGPLEIPAPAAPPAGSALSRFLGSLRNLPNVDARADASLADVADSAMRCLHQSSQRYKPSVQLLLEGLPPADRQETLVWLVQAFDVMHFTDATLFDTALLLDRYYACLPREEIRGGGSQRKLLAAVCMALKTGSQEDMQFSLRQVVTHLGQDQVPFREVLEAELVMLKKLKFTIGTPTARDFVEALRTRLLNCERNTGCLADFLLQLTLADAHLHYKYPHSVLAGAALSLALFATRAPPTAYVALLEDLALQSPESAAPNGQLVPCCAEIHLLWVQSFNGQEIPTATYAKHLYAKFSRASHQNVSTLVPPALPPLSLPPVQSWAHAPLPGHSPGLGGHSPGHAPGLGQPPARTALTVDNSDTPAASGRGQMQEELQDALNIVRQSLIAAHHSPSGTTEASGGSSRSSKEGRRHSAESKCVRCGRQWQHHPLEPRGCCPECGGVGCAADDPLLETLSHQMERLTLQRTGAHGSQGSEHHGDQTPNHWSTILATRLRGPAESNWKVRCVLARHGWASGRFRRTPDREQLLRDLARTAQVAGTAGRSSSSAAAAPAGSATVLGIAQASFRPHTRAQPSSGGATDLRAGTEPAQRCGGGAVGVGSQARGGAEASAGGTAAGSSAGALRKRRANSWCARRCGHRNTVSTRVGGGTATAGGIGHTTCSGVRRRGASRSP